MNADPLESAVPLPHLGRYPVSAIVFHWSMFVLIVIVGILGLLHDSWPKQTQAFWINIHAVLGLLMWVVLMARIAYRIRNPPPPLPEQIGALSRRFSSPVHLALYALMFVIPIVGVVTFIFHGRVFDFGLFRVDFGVQKNRTIFHPTEDLHGYLAYVLFGLAGLHSLAALWHHFALHDGVLNRMWPAREPRADVNSANRRL
jgi:cytochrome b561